MGKNLFKNLEYSLCITLKAHVDWEYEFHKMIMHRNILPNMLILPYYQKFEILVTRKMITSNAS